MDNWIRKKNLECTVVNCLAFYLDFLYILIHGVEPGFVRIVVVYNGATDDHLSLRKIFIGREMII